MPHDAAIGMAVSEVPPKGSHVLNSFYQKAWDPYQTAGLRARIKRLCLKAFGVSSFDLIPNGDKGMHAFQHTFGVTVQE